MNSIIPQVRQRYGLMSILDTTEMYAVSGWAGLRRTEGGGKEKGEGGGRTVLAGLSRNRKQLRCSYRLSVRLRRGLGRNIQSPATVLGERKSLPNEATVPATFTLWLVQCVRERECVCVGVCVCACTCSRVPAKSVLSVSTKRGDDQLLPSCW